MKVGDTFPVAIAGERVADATVKEIRDSEVVLVVPATLVTMSYRTHDELTPNDPADSAPETVEGSDHVLLTDNVEVKPPTESVTPEQAATQQVPGTTEVPATPPTQPDTVPTPEQAPVVPPIPEHVEDAVEQKATE